MVSFEKTGIVTANGATEILDKNGDSIQNLYGYAHGYIEDDSSTQQMSIHEDYILVTEFIEY